MDAPSERNEVIQPTADAPALPDAQAETQTQTPQGYEMHTGELWTPSSSTL